jgi:hypothetical protein
LSIVDAAARTRDRNELADVESGNVKAGADRADIQILAVTVDLAAIGHDRMSALRPVTTIVGASVPIITLGGHVAATEDGLGLTGAGGLVAGVDRAEILIVTIAIDQATIRRDVEVALTRDDVALAANTGRRRRTIRVVLAATGEWLVDAKRRITEIRGANITVDAILGVHAAARLGLKLAVPAHGIAERQDTGIGRLTVHVGLAAALCDRMNTLAVPVVAAIRCAEDPVVTIVVLVAAAG